MNLSKLNIKITYSLKTKSKNEYYIIINKSNIETKYITVTNNIEEICSCIGVLLLNKYSISIIEDKLNLIKTNNTIKSIISKAKLNEPKKNYLVPRYSYFPNGNRELIYLVRKLIEIRGNECNLNDIDTSKITNMDSIFGGVDFKGDISNWNTSNVENMSYMFTESIFDGNISNWNTSNVRSMSSMFENAKFNQDISNWNVSNVERVDDIFHNSKMTKYNRDKFMLKFNIV